MNHAPTCRFGLADSAAAAYVIKALPYSCVTTAAALLQWHGDATDASTQGTCLLPSLSTVIRNKIQSPAPPALKAGVCRTKRKKIHRLESRAKANCVYMCKL